MAAPLQTQKQGVTLKGSAAIVSEFFDYGINSILYQRGIYPEYMFARKIQYGLPLMMTNDDKLKKYLSTVLSNVKEWLLKLSVQKLVVVIKSTIDDEVLERWQFDIICDKACDKEKAVSGPDETAIRKDIQGVIRQITSSVTFLPLLDCPCKFDILVYTDEDTEMPQEWQECGPCHIEGEAKVKLRSFSTKIHTVDSTVGYKC